MPYHFPDMAGEPFMPSNGTAGTIFCGKFCDNCIHQHPSPDSDHQCNDILLLSLIGEQPKEWVYDSTGRPTCTAFVRWDWGNGRDGWNDPRDPNGPLAPEPPSDPNQLLMPFSVIELFGLDDPNIVVTQKAILEIA